MDSLRRRPTPKQLQPLPQSKTVLETRLHQKRSSGSFSHSFTLPPKNPPITPRRRVIHERNKSPGIKKIFSTIFFFLLLALFIGTSLILWRAYRVSQTTFTQKPEKGIISETTQYLLGNSRDNRKPLHGEADGRINVLLLGKAGKNYPGQNLTDTIIVASIDTKERKTALLSLPRDLYTRIPNTNTSTKLNALYFYGQNESDPFGIVRSAIEEITGLPIHYTIALDYDGFVKIIDALGGVNVTVERDFYDPAFPGPNYSYETFEIKKGFHTLDGSTALKYVRERHNDPMGDFGRSARQQQTIQAIKNKAFTLETFLNPFTVYTLLGTIEANIRTDFSPEEIASVLELIQDVDTQNINTYVVDAWKPDSLLRVSHIALENGQNMFVLIPRTGTYQEIRELALTIFSQDEQKIRIQKIKEESPYIVLINTTGNPQLIENVRALLSDLGFNNITTADPIDTAPLSRTYVRKMSENAKPYSLDEIIKKIPASLSGESLDDSIPKKIPEDTDITILLGNDITQNYLWEKGALEDYLKESE